MGPPGPSQPAAWRAHHRDAVGTLGILRRAFAILCHDWTGRAAFLDGVTSLAPTQTSRRIPEYANDTLRFACLHSTCAYHTGASCRRLRPDLSFDSLVSVTTHHDLPHSCSYGVSAGAALRFEP